MKLTKKQAIDRSIELWTWLAETGKMKQEWPEWENYGEICADCFLCQYEQEFGQPTRCVHCPYALEFGECCGIGTPFAKWDKVFMPFYRKKYATLFLEQLKELKK